MLREVGAVDVRADGRRRLYRVNGAALEPIYDWVKSFERTWSERFEPMDAVLEEIERDEGGGSGGGQRDGEGGSAERRGDPDHKGVRRAQAPGLPRLDDARAGRALVDGAARRGEIVSVEIDLRVGGRWRYAMLAHGGLEVAFHGTYRELVPDERVVSTEVFDAGRDAHIATGTEDGLQDALELLEGRGRLAAPSEAGADTPVPRTGRRRGSSASSSSAASASRSGATRRRSARWSRLSRWP